MKTSDLIEKLLQQMDLLQQNGDSQELVELIALAVREIEMLRDYKEMYIDLWKD